MPRGDKSARTDQPKRQANAMEKGPKGAARPGADARAWATANKPQGPSPKIAARSKLPSGPLGGSARKTNLARSS